MAYVINDNCVACGTCAAACPVEAISEGISIKSIQTLASAAVLAQKTAQATLSTRLNPHRKSKTTAGVSH